MTDLLFKVLNSDGSAYHGGCGQWSLPNSKPGAWMPPIANIEPCVRGYHLCSPTDLVYWLGPTIYVAEYRGECVAANDKVVVAEARLLRLCEQWTERTARLFACDCAERVLPSDADPHSRDAIAVSRRYAEGDATDAELAAAWAAAWAAASDAARAAARAAAAAAASTAAWAAERQWQAARLMELLEVGYEHV